MPNKQKPLVPPDVTRCQAEIREGSFMTLGPRSMVRCPNKPVWLATEVEPGEDGRKGSMALCKDCAKVFMDWSDKYPRVQLQPLDTASSVDDEAEQVIADVIDFELGQGGNARAAARAIVRDLKRNRIPGITFNFETTVENRPDRDRLARIMCKAANDAGADAPNWLAFRRYADMFLKAGADSEETDA